MKLHLEIFLIFIERSYSLCRVKPKTKKEAEIAKGFNGGKGNIDTVNIVTDHQISLTAPVESQTFKTSVKGGKGRLIQSYSFTKILRPELGQQELFSSLVRPMVKDFMEGQNQLLFTYGATSAGKTWTMQGELGDSGIIPRSLDTVFNTIGEQISESVPVQPVGFNRVVGITQGELVQAKKDKEAVFRLGLDLNKKTGGRLSPDISTMSGCSAASSGSSVCSSVDLASLANLHQLFPNLATRDKEASKLDIKDEHITYGVWVSFAEIYQDICYDLLTKVHDSKKKGERVSLRLCEERDGLPYVKGLREVQVSSADEAFQILAIGRDNLHFAATKLNQTSSRSHCIFTIKVVRVADSSKPNLARVSIFSFCDLAGSERIGKTNNIGERQKETGNINTSLLILGRCIKAMRHNQNCKDKKGHEVIPFRESKLTRLFKSYFSGHGKSSLIICISQAEYLFDETVHVCKFAHLASKVTIETFKDPPPKKAAKKSLSRFSTMVDREKTKLLSLAANASVLGRSSIAWAVPPGKKSSLFPTFKPSARSTMAPGSFQPPRMSSLLNLSEIEEPPEEEEETILDNTVVQTQYEGLLRLVEDLKSKLVEERKKNVDLEKNIREELCNEFNTMLVEVEKGYEKRLQVEREEAERVNEWRIGELNKVHSKRNKRRRENDDQEEDFNEGELEAVRLQSQLESKTKEVDNIRKELEEASDQVEVMKETVLKSKQEQDKLQGANTKIQFEMVEQKRLASELGRELSLATCKLEEERRKVASIKDGESDALVESERSLAQVREELTKMEEEVGDLKELLQEAGNEFIVKEEELQASEKELKEREDQVNDQGLVIEDLQTQLQESNLVLQEVNNQLEDKEKKIEDLEQALERTEKATNEKLAQRITCLEEELSLAKMKCQTANEFSEEIKKKLENSEAKAEEERTHATEAENKMLEAQQERNQLLSVKNKLLEEIAEIKSKGDHKTDNETLSSEEEVGDLEDKVNNLKGLNKVLSDSNETLRTDNDELRKEVSSLKLKVDELKSATSVDESLFEDEDDLKERIESLLTEKCSLRDSLSSVKSEMEVLKTERTRLLSQIEKQEAKDFTEVENLIEKNTLLEEELSKERSTKENEFNNLKSQVEENLNHIKTAEENLKELQKLLDEKDGLIANLKEERLCLENDLTSRINEVKENFKATNKLKENEFEEQISKKKEIIAKLEKEMKENKSQNYSSEQERSIKLSDLESRNGSLEKDVATKDTYIKELEDIIVEKEFKISELENMPQDSQKNLEKLTKEHKDKLTKEKENAVKLDLEIKKLQKEASENQMTIAHQEKMKSQRESLEEKIKDFKKTTDSLAKTEDEKNALEKKFRISEALNQKLKAEVEDFKDEVKALKKATKNSAKEALEASELKSQNEELKKELERLKVLMDAHKREEDALDVLKDEISGKSSDLKSLQGHLQQLRSELGGKDKELEQLESEMERVRAENEAKEYDLNKIKEERANLMEHYEKIFKQKQAEIDSIKEKDKEKGSLGDIMAKATPSKSLSQVKKKLEKAEEDLYTVREKLAKEEDKVGELKIELKTLQKEFDEKTSQHQRELNRTKLANEKVCLISPNL